MSTEPNRNFTLNQLRYFSVVAQEGGMTAAAGRLSITQSALSSAIAQLEARWGCRSSAGSHARG